MRARPQLTRRLAVVGALSALIVTGCGATTAGTATVGDAPAGTTRTASTSPDPDSGPVVSTVTVTWSPPPTTIPADDLAGEQFGFITAVDLAGSKLTMDRITWFTGAEAQGACDEDEVTDRPDGWCTDYYYRNNNSALRVVSVAPDAVITSLQGGKVAAPSDLATVAAGLGNPDPNPWRLVVTDGRVTQLEEIYLP